MLVSDFDFDLPPDLIAQDPAVERTDARLLHLSRSTGKVVHLGVSDLPSLLRPGDLVVVNNTRVFPARLLGRRVPSGGGVECLLIGRADDPDQRADGEVWEALVHPGQKLKPGAQVIFDGATPIHGEVLDRRFFGRRAVRLWTDAGTTVTEAVEQIGHMPLPPYIKREDRNLDRDRYQTVFARPRGSIAAPTAGLHFNASLIASLADHQVKVAEVTLHVGYGTFQPIRVAQVEDHRLEAERYDVSAETAAAINRALDDGRRVVAVGTTTTRTLEAVAAANDGRMAPAAGQTDLFIYPGFRFSVVTGLMTNFHLPQSSLLMLVSALAGRERVLGAYREAVAQRYRFYSYGDAMVVL